MRVQSDDAEFSIEVPLKHSFFLDQQGFSVSGPRGDLSIRKMEMLNAVIDGSLISFERYQASKDALARIYERDAWRKEVSEKISLKRDPLNIQQLISKTNQYHLVRQYFATAKHIYVLTAASRRGETPEITRFFNSVSTKRETGPADVGILFSRLQATQIEIEEPGGRPELAPSDRALQIRKPDPDERPLLFLVRPTPWYIERARAARVKGTIIVRLTLSEDGFIPKISFVRSLMNGLDRQAIFAALTLKFLPAEKAGVPQTVVRTLEYTFDIY